MADTKLKITLVNSAIGSNDKQRATLQALGLHKLNSSVIQKDSPEIRGMVQKMKHLLSVETLEAEEV